MPKKRKLEKGLLRIRGTVFFKQENVETFDLSATWNNSYSMGSANAWKNIPFNGPMLTEKAKYPNDQNEFTASSGYISNFCRRHNLRNVSIQSEKISADRITFLAFTNSFILEIAPNYTRDQVFNFDESGPFYKSSSEQNLYNRQHNISGAWT